MMSWREPSAVRHLWYLSEAKENVQLHENTKNANGKRNPRVQSNAQRQTPRYENVMLFLVFLYPFVRTYPFVIEGSSRWRRSQGDLRRFCSRSKRDDQSVVLLEKLGDAIPVTHKSVV